MERIILGDFQRWKEKRSKEYYRLKSKQRKSIHHFLKIDLKVGMLLLINIVSNMGIIRALSIEFLNKVVGNRYNLIKTQIK